MKDNLRLKVTNVLSLGSHIRNIYSGRRKINSNQIAVIINGLNVNVRHLYQRPSIAESNRARLLGVPISQTQRQPNIPQKFWIQTVLAQDVVS